MAKAGRWPLHPARAGVGLLVAPWGRTHKVWGVVGWVGLVGMLVRGAAAVPEFVEDFG
ncbi:hypothetical protein GCM10022402_30490 [Salinactinospora qingdaonensis]|uniref:Uncharacterized protein n=1 Tax=Salinactinospora qingdaonensis TaxID=702744 RepID=A0ABP7FWY8_9ACTN